MPPQILRPSLWEKPTFVEETIVLLTEFYTFVERCSIQVSERFDASEAQDVDIKFYQPALAAMRKKIEAMGGSYPNRHDIEGVNAFTEQCRLECAVDPKDLDNDRLDAINPKMYALKLREDAAHSLLLKRKQDRVGSIILYKGTSNRDDQSPPRALRIIKYVNDPLDDIGEHWILKADNEPDETPGILVLEDDFRHCVQTI